MSGGSLSRREADAQYRPKGYGLSPGLQRARAPYRLKNALTGIAIASFAVGVWAYSIRAVKQDTFEDVDEEAKALMASRMTSGASPAASPREHAGSGDGTAAGPGSVSLEKMSSAALDAAPSPRLNAAATGEAEGRAGILASIFPHVVGHGQTLVKGAPSVDHLGRLGDKVDKRT